MGLPEEVINAAQMAVKFDEDNQNEIASYYYQAAARFLIETANSSSDENSGAWKEKAQQYLNRAEQLKDKKIKESKSESVKSKDEVLSEKCHFLLSQALDADEAGLKDTAVQLYMESIEFSLNAKKEISDGQIQQKLSNLAKQALDRAEELKGISSSRQNLATVSEEASGTADWVRGNTFQESSVKPKATLHRGSSQHLKVSGRDTYTEEEKLVLLTTSKINNLNFVPFMNVDLAEKFQYAIPFTDKEGPLILSPKQKRDFVAWVRPSEFCSEPKMVDGESVDYFSIKQTIVSDCSFVASLAVSALYERRFGKRLVTSIIYPRNRNKEPIYNPFGKYMVKLHLNGITRKIIIDDQLPMTKYNQLLCSYSQNKNELWVSLLEKAYMKVMGGYDFPGSNSNIDLHALTGWIPERLAIRTKDDDFNADSVFENLFTRLHKGDVLVTVATGDLSPGEEERTGLVSTHAYAVLDVRKVNGLRLLQLKNPWSNVRWRGNYSELDRLHWTPELKRALNFDPNSASMFDNGIFWIDYESILRFYDVFYMNWNPGLFSHTFCVHQSWVAGQGPIKDVYNIGENPQFRLELSGGGGGGAVWILLTRHITQLEDFKQNREYITVLVYKNDGKRVYYPYDPPPYLDGVRINSPHYLTKIILNESSPKRFTLVVSQYEKMHTIYYSLRAYATCPFRLEKIENPYRFKQEISGEWKGITAGGCPNHPSTYQNNPRFQVTLESARTLGSDNSLLVFLKGPKQYSLGMKVTCVGLDDETLTAPFKTKDSGAYRSGFVALELDSLPAGTYEIMPSTFSPQQEGPFFLELKSSCGMTVTRVR
uniref:Calpain-7 n=1 Tax=Cacopsylla melanoneura TaxID=428564 RepID=A0A8D8STI1_9HEMI